DRLVNGLSDLRGRRGPCSRSLCPSGPRPERAREGFRSLAFPVRPDGVYDGVGELLAVIGGVQARFLDRARDEARLEENGRHARPGENVEAGSAHAEVLGSAVTLPERG